MENREINIQEENKESTNFFKILSFILLTLLIISVVFIYNKNQKIAELEKGVNEKIVYVNDEGEIQVELEGIKNNLEKSVEIIKEKDEKIAKLQKELEDKEAEIKKLKESKGVSITAKPVTIKSSGDTETKTVTKYITKPTVKYVIKTVYPTEYQTYLQKELQTQQLIAKYELQDKSVDEILEMMTETLKDLQEQLK